MNRDIWPNTTEIQNAFAQELAVVGGSLSDTFDDGERLFARSILPGTKEVRSGDRLQAGVAVRATDQDLCVHPYVYRLVCRNGAIRAQAIQSWRIERDDISAAPDRSAHDVLFLLRDAVQHCCADEAFVDATDAMRSAMLREADMALMLLPMLARLPGDAAQRMLQQIMGNFGREGDRSQFGLMNAVTATARDTRDPEMRWRLEELGGAIPALRLPSRRPGGTSVDNRRAAAAELVASRV
jgi:hypothetical protein